METQKNYIREIETVISRYAPFLSQNDAGFLHRVFDKGISIYHDRIVQYGMTGLKRVLDAGCGYGQWSLALASENEKVTAIDIGSDRLLFLADLAHELECKNLTVQYSEIFKTDFPDESFDAIFCYSVIYHTPWRETLSEFARILQPGGKLYVNTNGMGWYKHLWKTKHNVTSGYDPKHKAAEVLLNTLHYERGIPLIPQADLLIEPEELTLELKRCGFQDIRLGGEGTLSVKGSVTTKPFFEEKYDGETGVYEILAAKKT